jgi:signal transduction histidine kinase
MMFADINTLVTVAGYELRTPITPLKMRLQRTQARLQRDSSEGLSASAHNHRHDIEDLSKALYHVERLQQQAALLLDALALTQDFFDLAPRWLDLSQTARRLVEIYACADSQRVITFQDADIPVTGVWDGARLEIVIREMLGNALRYASGHVTLRLARQGSLVLITVDDEGVGMPGSLRARAFDPFVTGSQSNHGLGLGLYVAREIARHHGGEMGVERTESGGSSVWLTLPLDGATPG